VRFRFTGLTPVQRVALALAFTTGELAPSNVTLIHASDTYGRCAFKIDHTSMTRGPRASRCAK
jgi:hypothetical protein